MTKQLMKTANNIQIVFCDTYKDHLLYVVKAYGKVLCRHSTFRDALCYVGNYLIQNKAFENMTKTV